MGGMMGATSGWVLLWTLLAVVLVVAGGIVAARALVARHGAEPPQVRAGDSPALRDARVGASSWRTRARRCRARAGA